MTPLSEQEARLRLESNGQQHVLRFWNRLDSGGKKRLLDQVALIDFPLMKRLTEKWVLKDPPPESFERIEPIPIIPVADLARADLARADAKEAWDAGVEALCAGRVGLLLVAGGQGTRLGFDGPKGAYPIGPISKRSLFAFHAEKIHNIQNRYGCTLPWYIMVSETNEEATRAFFQQNDSFGLNAEDIVFFRQRMAPCVDEQGRFMLDAPDRLAMNPNGHGGVIPAMVENGLTGDARKRGVDTLSYFQVDNWAIKVADPFFIGYHVLNNGEMSSKVHKKNDPREAVGVHCLCDGQYRTIEYSELDIYPQLLQVDPQGELIHPAGNPAIHILSIDFIERVFGNFDEFPWHRAHKKIPFMDEAGNLVKPDKPNGYKFETFVFDALRFIRHKPIALMIDRRGEYTPIKSFEGSNSVQAAWRSQAEYWAGWLEAVGRRVPRDSTGMPTIRLEISPQYAFSKQEFVGKAAHRVFPDGDLAIGPDGAVIRN